MYSIDSIGLDAVANIRLLTSINQNQQATQPALAGDTNRFANVINQNPKGVQGKQPPTGPQGAADTDELAELGGLDSPEDIASAISQLMFALQPIDLSSFYGFNSNPFDFSSKNNLLSGSFGNYPRESNPNGRFG